MVRDWKSRSASLSGKGAVIVADCPMTAERLNNPTIDMRRHLFIMTGRIFSPLPGGSSEPPKHSGSSVIIQVDNGVKINVRIIS